MKVSKTYVIDYFEHLVEKYNSLLNRVRLYTQLIKKKPMENSQDIHREIVFDAEILVKKLVHMKNITVQNYSIEDFFLQQNRYITILQKLEKFLKQAYTLLIFPSITEKQVIYKLV